MSGNPKIGARNLKLRAVKLQVEAWCSKFASLRIAGFGFTISIFLGLGIILAMLLFATPAFAQGCVMCYNTAAAAKAAAINALRSGILILMVPPVLISAGVFVLALRGRERFNDENDGDRVDDRELNRRLAPAPWDEENPV
jgi:hypothetical protein